MLVILWVGAGTMCAWVRAHQIGAPFTPAERRELAWLILFGPLGLMYGVARGIVWGIERIMDRDA